MLSLFGAALSAVVLLVAPAATQTGGSEVVAAKAYRDACGAGKIKARASGTYWTCTLVDGFNGTALNRKLWHVMAQPSDGLACQVDSPATVSVSGGTLKLRAVRSGSGGATCPPRWNGARGTYATGWINTFNNWSQQYGRFEVRMRNTDTRNPGLQEAFWLWPDMRYSGGYWPDHGEIDVVETYSQYPDLMVPYLHYTFNDNGGPIPGLNTAWNCQAKRGVWNTYALEWDANRVSIFVNDQLCLTNTAGAPTFRKRFIMSLSQMIGVGGNSPTAGTPIPATTEVDYVKVWR